MYIDLHCHLDYVRNLDKVVENAKKADVKIIVTNGVNPKTNRKVLEMAKKYDIIKAALGIYPIDALEREGAANIFDLDKELEFIKKNKNNIVALGEVGLDYFNGKDKKMQKEVLNKVIEVAKKINKPIIVHSRKAAEDAVDLIESTGHKKVVLHFFNGKKGLVKRAEDLGWYFTIPTNIVRANDIQSMARRVNINRLFCETDSPWLSPFKGKENEPAFVVEAYKKLAEEKKLTLEEVKKNIYLNYQKLFL